MNMTQLRIDKKRKEKKKCPCAFPLMWYILIMKERFTHTPKVGARYNWNNSLVQVLDIKTERLTSREAIDEDGRVVITPERDFHVVKIKDITEGGKFENQVLTTPWTKYSFEIV
jgi:hypothetical protein